MGGCLAGEFFDWSAVDLVIPVNGGKQSCLSERKETGRPVERSRMVVVVMRADADGCHDETDMLYVWDWI